MNHHGPKIIQRALAWIIAHRWWVVAIYAALLGPSIYFSLGVDQDNSLDRLIVDTDPDYIATRDFGKVFTQGEFALLFVEADNPYSPAVLTRFDQLERDLHALPNTSTNSALSIFRRAHAGFDAKIQADDFKKFATGTKLFRKQGIVGDHFLAIPVLLNVHSGHDRGLALDAIDEVLKDLDPNPAPFTAIRKVGQPYINAYLDNDTRSVGVTYFPLFGAFMVILIIGLYRSARALLAFIISLATSVALTVGLVGAVGGVFTIVSALVPMTVLITCTATLVYLHSRFVDQPEGLDLDKHQVLAFANKFLPCTASLFAAAVGFAALTVSQIRPIREMGLSVAVGMLFIWVVVFTLFPSLQKIFKTPTQLKRKIAGQWFIRFTRWLPLFTYRYRWPFVSGALLISAAGVVAIFGLPGYLKPMHLMTNPVDYINPETELYKYTKKLEEVTAGLAITEVWLKGELGSVSEPEVIRGLNRFQEILEQEEMIGSATGLPTILRMLRYIGGKGDTLPEDLEQLERITDSLEAFLPREPMLQSFVDPLNMSQTHVMVITKTVDYEGYQQLDHIIRECWKKAVAGEPMLKTFELKTVGLAPLTAKISYHLVPTLVESFGLTLLIIFGTFLIIFRSGAARLMAMIPSLFAILAMFIFMRATGISLNVATILIASTVLGVTENDQIHFFYHFLENKDAKTTEQRLQHTLMVSGRAIFFATLINAGGFLAFSLADLPPIRHFGVLSSLAFLLAMVADFTALPAALWIFYRDKPDSIKEAEAKEAAAVSLG